MHAWCHSLATSDCRCSTFLSCFDGSEISIESNESNRMRINQRITGEKNLIHFLLYNMFGFIY